MVDRDHDFCIVASLTHLIVVSYCPLCLFFLSQDIIQSLPCPFGLTLSLKDLIFRVFSVHEETLRKIRLDQNLQGHHSNIGIMQPPNVQAFQLNLSSRR